MARLVRFGSIDLPPTFAPGSDDLGRVIEPAKHLRTDGARIITGYAGEKVIPVRGTLIKGPIPNLGVYSDLRAAVDALRTNLAGGPANLYFWDDRYYRQVQAQGVSVSYAEQRYETIANVEIQFVTGDPFGYYHNETLDVWTGPTNGATRTITPGGNAYALPTYKFTTGSTTIDWRLTNTTTGKYFTLVGSGLTIGNLIEVNVMDKTVKIGATDEMDLFDGQFPELSAGGSLYTMTVNSGTITKVATHYQNRYWG